MLFYIFFIIIIKNFKKKVNDRRKIITFSVKQTTTKPLKSQIQTELNEQIIITTTEFELVDLIQFLFTMAKCFWYFIRFISVWVSVSSEIWNYTRDTREFWTQYTIINGNERSFMQNVKTGFHIFWSKWYFEILSHNFVM